MHTILMKGVNKIRKITEFGGIMSKISVAVEIVDITPHYVKRNTIMCIIRDYILKILSVCIAPSTLMPSKSPLRDH